GLSSAKRLVLCWWPGCEMQPRAPELREAVVRALDRELRRRDLPAHAVPTLSTKRGYGDGAYVQLVFYFDEHNQLDIDFDRRAQLLLLPYGGGWANAPSELAKLLESVLPPT